jgi:hypothetical protein
LAVLNETIQKRAYGASLAIKPYTNSYAVLRRGGYMAAAAVAKVFHLRHPKWAPKDDPEKCAFECEVERLGLTGESLFQLASAIDLKHRSLRFWAKRHARTRYVPTFLLEAWGIYLDEDCVLVSNY